MGLLKRVAFTLTLGLLAPLVAEYLLGDLRITNLAALPILVCMYGCGSVLIREIVSRKGRSWTVFLTLAVAYAVLEEGIVDQSFFNPDFMHLHLLAYGFWPRLGTAPVWVICVTTLHVVWSLAVPIGMTESLFPERSMKPWLGRPGLVVTFLLFLLGSSAIGSYFHRTAAYCASIGQITACLVLIVGLIGTVFVSPRSRPMTSATPFRVRPLWLGIIAFVAGSVFVVLYGIGASILHWPDIVTASAEAGLHAFIILLLWKSCPRNWTPLQVWAASTGGLLVYAWHGYRVDRALHGSSDTIDHTFIVVALCAVQAAAWFRVTHFRGASD